MFTGWMSFAGVEIVNDARLAVYVKALQIPGTNCEECPSLAAALEETYTDPATDNAPWYDPNVPESANVAGFQIATNGTGVPIEGLGDTGTRNVDQLTIDGGVIGRRRRATREMTMTIRAVASTQCAMTYAVAWLARVLRGSECSPINIDISQALPLTLPCSTNELCVFSCCPQTPQDIDTYRVSLFKVGLTEGPSPIASYSTFSDGKCGLVLCELEITLTAADPGFYGAPVTVIDAPVIQHFLDTSFEDWDSLFCGTATTSQVCLIDNVPEGCTTTESPGVVQPARPCVGPTEGIFNVYSIPFDLSSFGAWTDLVPIIYYKASGMGAYTGEQDPSVFQENNYEGPVGFSIRRSTTAEPCGELSNICSYCSEIFSPMMGTAQTSVIDWISRKAYRVATSTTNLCPFAIYSRGLTPFNWPTLTCAQSMCLDVSIWADRDGREAEVKLDILPRRDVLC